MSCINSCIGWVHVYWNASIWMICRVRRDVLADWYRVICHVVHFVPRVNWLCRGSSGLNGEWIYIQYSALRRFRWALNRERRAPVYESYVWEEYESPLRVVWDSTESKALSCICEMQVHGHGMIQGGSWNNSYLWIRRYGII